MNQLNSCFRRLAFGQGSSATVKKKKENYGRPNLLQVICVSRESMFYSKKNIKEADRKIRERCFLQPLLFDSMSKSKCGNVKCILPNQ